MLTAQFPSTCGACHKPIVPGQKIERPQGAKQYQHTDCQNPGSGNGKTVETPARPRQLEYMRNLLAERELPADLAVPDEPTFLQASIIIDALKTAPKRIPTGSELAGLPGPEEVPAGRYAIVLTVGGVEHDVLIRVWRGSQNPHHVRCYDEDSDQPVQVRDALQRIVDFGAFDAARRYGQLRRRCSRCNHPLRNRLSVELAIGPDCLKHFHPPTLVAVMKENARSRIRERGEDPNETVYSADMATIGGHE